jgi:hypothetical protein
MTVTPVAVPATVAEDLASRAETLSLDDLPGRDLDEEELRSLASTIASHPELWQHHLAFSDDQRVYASLHRDAYVDVWLLCWTEENDTGFHDHDISSGAVAVVTGALEEHNLGVGGSDVTTLVPAGKVFSFGPDHIHRLTGAVHASVSVHAYSPPLLRMGQYAVGPGGVLRRQSVSHADELRPLE